MGAKPRVVYECNLKKKNLDTGLYERCTGVGVKGVMRRHMYHHHKKHILDKRTLTCPAANCNKKFWLKHYDLKSHLKSCIEFQKENEDNQSENEDNQSE